MCNMRVFLIVIYKLISDFNMEYIKYLMKCVGLDKEAHAVI